MLSLLRWHRLRAFQSMTSTRSCCSTRTCMQILCTSMTPALRFRATRQPQRSELRLRGSSHSSKFAIFYRKKTGQDGTETVSPALWDEGTSEGVFQRKLEEASIRSIILERL